MKKIFAIAKRNFTEMFRDPVSLLLCLAFPLLMLCLMQLLFSNMQYLPENFKIENYASGICVFGYTFISLYVALQITTDKNTSFIKRLNISPIRRTDYIFSFYLSALPMTLLQTVIFFLVALIFGFPFNIYFLISILYLIPSAVLYISIGILIGIISKNGKMTGPISSIFISFIGIFGGIFTPASTFTGTFGKIINFLPFTHSVEIASGLHSIGFSCIYPHILYVVGYTVLIVGITLLVDHLATKHR